MKVITVDSKDGDIIIVRASRLNMNGGYDVSYPDFKEVNIPTGDEIDVKAIDFCKANCTPTKGDLTYETEIFTAGAEWVINKLLKQ